MSTDEIIRDMWKICMAFDDADCVDFDVLVDQWWVVKATCEHGSWLAASNGPIDLRNAFDRTYMKFKDAHERIESGIST